jgi:hypothetical protein
LGQSRDQLLSHRFRPTVTNEFRVGYNYGHFTLRQQRHKDISKQLGFGGIPVWTPLEEVWFKSRSTGQCERRRGPVWRLAVYAYDRTPEHRPSPDNVTKILGKPRSEIWRDLQYIRYSTIQPQALTASNFRWALHRHATGSANGFVAATSSQQNEFGH